MDKNDGVYRQFYFDEETQETYLIHGTIEDGFAVYLNGKEVPAGEELPILQATVSKSKMWADELERRERAAIRCKERHSHIPFYQNRSMDFWRGFQGSAALADYL